MSLDSILDEVRAKRAEQDARWGGPAHDDTHAPHDWVALTTKYSGLSIAGLDAGGVDQALFRRHMLSVAALALAAIESLDRRGGVAVPKVAGVDGSQWKGW